MNKYKYVGTYEIIVLCASFHGIVKQDDVLEMTEQEVAELGRHLFVKVDVKTTKETKTDG